MFGISIKDRSAISMAGHSGKAYWFSKKTLGFVTSTYYHDQYPKWISAWNDRQLANAYGGQRWELMKPKATYLLGEADDRIWEANIPGWGRVFPHSYGEAEGGQFASFLTFSPATDELLLEFAKTLIDAEQLGVDGITDYLSIGFSATDYIGHLFGPSSLEAEDNMLRLDRTLARLFAYVDQRIGLKDVLIVLSADHGAPEIPAYLRTLGIPSGYLMPNLWEKHQGIIDLKHRFGIGKELIKAYYHPYVYLNHEVIAEKGLNLTEVEATVAAELLKLDGVAFAITSRDLRENRLPDTREMRLVKANYQRDRSGDIFIVHQPHYFVNDFDGANAASVHGSPWRYDTFVPIVFAGLNLKPQKVFREVETVDVAPTLAALVAAKPPSGSRGNPLLEVLAGRK